MIAFAADIEPDDDPRGSGGESALAEYTRGDLVLIRSQVAAGVVPPDRMARMTSDISEMVENPDTPQRHRIAAYKALAALQLGMLKLWADLHKQPAAEAAAAAGTTTNQQINIYLPANARETEGGQLTNGNGRH